MISCYFTKASKEFWVEKKLGVTNLFSVENTNWFRFSKRSKRIHA
jgi:hypothetical protein